MASRKTNKTTESFMSKGTDPRKKPKTQSSLALTFGNNAFLLSSLRKTHTGKRILLRAKDIYSGTATGHNLFDYIDIRGRIDLVRFFSDHSKVFPTLWVIAQKELSRRVVEVGCERFFGLLGYISSPRRTRLGVRTYERLAMLASIVHTVYIDDALVAAEYLRRCKAGSWKKENTVEAVKCWNLERIIDDELRGESMPEEEITMNDLVNEDNACIN